MATPNNSQARRTAEKILAALESGPKTAEGICLVTKLSDNTVYRHLTLLMKLPKVVHVCGYNQSGPEGSRAKIFALGNKSNAKFTHKKKPKPNESASRAARKIKSEDDKPDPMPVTIRAPGIVIHRIAG